MTAEDTNRLISDLKRVPAFEGLPDEVYAWLVASGEEITLMTNEIAFREGEPADAASVVLEGELNMRVGQDGRDGRVYIVRAGQISGLLPYSRMTKWGATGRAVGRTRLLRLKSTHFPEMIRRFPDLVQRLVEILSDRIREVTRMDERHDKLLALGKLSAGLAHELNNPSAAASRAAQQLSETLSALNGLCLALNRHGLPREQVDFLAQFQQERAECVTAAPPLDPVAESECEDEITTWMERRGVDDAWELAPAFVRAGMSLEKLETLAAKLDGQVLNDALRWLAAAWSAKELVREIEHSTARISELVKSVKEYSYMDQAPVQEVDVHQGLENTLVILGHKLKRGVNVIREYDADLPRITAYGGALNQIWTNLIDNAIDALDGRGNLWIRTAVRGDYIQVEINDDGPGIPPEIQGRIFDPFFTTKPQGIGTGVGLDTVYQIVCKHHGEVDFQSRPGNTCFRVRLPFNAIDVRQKGTGSLPPNI